MYIYIYDFIKPLAAEIGHFHIPSVPLPLSFRYAGKAHACGTSCDEVLVANLVTLPFPFRFPSVILPLCR